MPATPSSSSNPGPVIHPAVLAAARGLVLPGQRRILGIAGAPAAGKSTLAGALVAHLADVAQSVPMDGYHLSQRELERLGRSARKGAPDTFDVHGYRDALLRIRQRFGSGEAVYAPDFHRDIEEPIAASLAIHGDTPLLITEGNYLLLDDEPWPAVAALLDEIWFLDVDTALREQWLVKRHQRFGRSGNEAWAWVEQTDRPNAARIISVAHKAQRKLCWDGTCIRFCN